MTVPYRKKLIEVGLPLVAINAESAREKSIRHGHPSTLHLWWARRPLAACRAVLFASLVDDPDSDPQYRKQNGSVDEEAAGIKRADLFNLIEELVMWENSNNTAVIHSARAEIARCVASRLIETGALKKDTPIGADTTAYNLVTRGHCRPIPLGLDTKVGRVRFSFDVSTLPSVDVVNGFLAKHAPPVLDPFCGGGSIPLEAQRLGLRAYASDLNPVPVLITKALIEIPPKFADRPPVNPNWQKKTKEEKAATVWHGAQGLAADVRYYGQWMRDEAEKRIGHLYPKVKITKELVRDRPDLEEYVGEELTIIAWLWARTVASPNPICKGAHVPLVSSLMLSTKEGKKAWAEIVHDSSALNGWRFQVRSGHISKELQAKAKLGTKAGKAKDFICSLTSTPIPRSYIQTEGKADHLAARLLALVCEGKRGRVFLSPDGHSESLASAANNMPIVEQSRQSFLSGETPTRAMITGGVCSAYGLRTWGHLFTPRQLVALTTFSDLVQGARPTVIHDAIAAGLPNDKGPPADNDCNATAYADAVVTYLAFGVNRTSNTLCTIARWTPDRGQTVTAFARQGLPMTWDYPEVNPFASAAGDIYVSIDTISNCIERLPATCEGHTVQLDVMGKLIDVESPVISTDPPYYDNIGYAILSDFFYVWLRRSLSGVYPSLFSTVLTPKTQELIVSPFRHDGDRVKAQRFFEMGLGSAFRSMCESQTNEFPLTVYYAFKQAESDEDEGEDREGNPTVTVASTGWETMLSGLIHSGYGIHGTWPMRSELANRPVASGTNALASSIVLVCRPRSANAPLATRRQFITALRQELPDALRNLQHGNIAPVDLAQAAIGPGMAVFTRYVKVIESDGSAMTVRTALGIINQSLDEVLAEQEGDFDGDTRWALAWFEQFGMTEGPFGDAETLSKAKDTAVNRLVEAGVIVAQAGKVRLVSRDELPADWSPATDKRLTVWEVTQHLIHRLDKQGEIGAATLVGQLGGVAEISRDLAYRLYSTCERKKWAQDALAYNSLVVAWSELTKLALSGRNRQPAMQHDLFT